MQVINVAHFPTRALQVAQAPTGDGKLLHVGTIGSLDELAAVMAEHQLPKPANVALPGKPVLSHYTPGDGPRELVSFGGGDQVILSLFYPGSGKGALVQVGGNDQDAIEQALATVLEHVASGDPKADLKATLFGGAWETSADDPGAKVRDGLIEKGITPTWHQWSFPKMGREDHHGVVLDLSNGQVTVFEHAAELADEYVNDLYDTSVWSDSEESYGDQLKFDGLVGLSEDRIWRSDEAAFSLRRTSESSETSELDSLPDTPLFGDSDGAASPLRRTSESSDVSERDYRPDATQYRLFFGSTESLTD